MISTWAAILFTAIAVIALGVGLYLLAWHRGYIVGFSDRTLDDLPVDPPWHPPTEVDFMQELHRAKEQQRTPEKYRREP